MLKQLNAELGQLVSDAQALRQSMEEKSKGGTAEYEGLSADREKFSKMIERGESIRKQIDELTRFDSLKTTVSGEPGERPLGGGNGNENGNNRQTRTKSVGQQVIETDQFTHASKQGKLDRVEIERKDLYESAAAAGGVLVFSDRDPELRELPQRPRSILDIVLSFPTSSNLVEIMQEKTNDNQAAGVAENATKPKSNITFDKINVPIITVATYVVASRQILDDAPRLRAFIDTRLRTFLEIEVEDQIVGGAGGNDLTGWLNVVGITGRTHGAVDPTGLKRANDNKLDTIRHAITVMRANFYRPTDIVLHPYQADEFETLKDAQGRYLERYDPVEGRLWRLPVTESSVPPNGTSIVVDRNRSSELYNRMSVAIYTDTINDQFIKNQFSILGELRLGLGTPYPKGITKIDGLEA